MVHAYLQRATETASSPPSHAQSPSSIDIRHLRTVHLANVFTVLPKKHMTKYATQTNKIQVHGRRSRRCHILVFHRNVNPHTIPTSTCGCYRRRGW